MKTSPPVFLIALICLSLGILIGWHAGATRANYHRILLSIDDAYVFDASSHSEDHPNQAIQFANSRIVWNLAVLNKYPSWAKWNIGNETKGFSGDTLLQFLPPEQINKLASPYGLSEIEIRKIANEAYPSKINGKSEKKTSEHENL